jgi:outer membrane protein TolC
MGSVLPIHGQPTENEAPAVHIAIVSDPSPRADSITAEVRRELQSLLTPAHALRNTATRASDAWTPEEAAAAYRTAARSTPDVVVAIGPVAMTGACALSDDDSHPPTIAVSTGSGVFAPKSDSSHCTTVGPVGWPANTLRTFQRLGHFKTLTVVADGRVTEVIPTSADRIRTRGEGAGIRTALVPFREAEATVDAVMKVSPDAVFVDHVDRTTGPKIKAVVGALTSHDLPVFTHDPALVKQHGALAAPDVAGRHRARQAALAAEQVITNTPPPARTVETDSVSVERPLVVNEATADVLGLSLPWDVQVSAHLVGTPAPDGDAFTLEAAMRESIAANLDLKAKRQGVAAQSNRLDAARARMLPQVQVSATGQTVSEDVAAASFGAQPERQVSSAVSVRQVIFSEPAFAQYGVERRMQAMREFRRESVRLDAAKNAADAYLAVLEARAGVTIQRENVRTVRTNLQAARTRRRAGAADPREVSRLEAELARAEQGLLQTLGRRRTAEIQYNRVLNRPLDAEVTLTQTATADPSDILAQFPYADRLEESSRAPAFQHFWVAEAEEHAPAAEAVERLVSARKRQLTSANRSFWTPEISLEGSLSQQLYEGGVGTSSPSLPLSNSPEGESSLPTTPDQQWSVGITASFPLFQGTERVARRRQVKKQLQATRTEQAVAELGVEQKVRTALVQLETAYASAKRALRAAEAAQQTLDVTEAAYREGTSSLIDLIDAQNAAVVTREEAATTAYEVLHQWVAVQRAGGSFRPLRTPQEQAAFEERLNAMLSGRPDAQ